MRCYLLIVVTVVAATITSASAQNRVPGQKMTLQQLQVLPASDRVVIKFREGSRVRIGDGQIKGISDRQSTNNFNRVMSEAGIPLTSVERMHGESEAELDTKRTTAQRKTGRRLADLNLYYVINLPQGVSAAELADKLNRLPFVEFAEPAPIPAPPPIYIVPEVPPEPPQLPRGMSPNFTSIQNYKNPAPRGIGVMNVAGSDGRGMSFVDVEYSWQLDHEDLQMTTADVVTVGATPVHPPAWTHHGTAVLGVLSGKRNAYGVTGIVPRATAMVAAADTNRLGYNPAAAISAAARRLSPGDVIVIEQQYRVCGSEQYGPLETLQSVFDAVANATAQDIIVVAAAGNGSVNLDKAECRNAFNRNARDSGAIIVGAGSPVDRSKLDFSSYGSRVDVQGWGESVATAGYGDAFNAALQRTYTRRFNGTSSATPVVAGAVLMIQGIRKACGMQPLAPSAMRNLLVRTGTPQGRPALGRIGPLPNAQGAVAAAVPARCLAPRPPEEAVAN
jgi:hypothetical protein